MKVTVVSPANIAFIKYWGQADHQIFLPRNNNISMTMSGCHTTTTVEVSDKIKKDQIQIQFYGQEYKPLGRKKIKEKNIYDQLKRIRQLANSQLKAKVKTTNNFPSDAGIASSASGFSALTSALILAYGLKDKFIDKQELSRQVRLCGSGSAVRSVYGGFVEMLAGPDHNSSYAVQIADSQHWDLVDIVAIVDPEKKKISSSLGHKLADTSPYFETRIKEMQTRISQCRQAILDKDLKTLGQAIEADSISMHAVMMTSHPPAFYWGPGSIRIIQDVIKWREEDNLQAYVTFDAGPNAHVICEKKDAAEVEKRLKQNPFVKWTIFNQPCEGAREIDQHLF